MSGIALEHWLWVATVATAVAGGALSIVGARRQRRDVAEGRKGGGGYRLVMASYLFMTASIVIFVVRGLL